MAKTIKFEVKNGCTGDVQFTANIECSKDESLSVKLGLAVHWAIKNGANLNGADLSSAEDAELAIAQTRILPEGELIGWKKCRDNILVKLLVPAEAKRSHAFGRKCRAEFVDVLEIIDAKKAVSKHDGETTYEVGKRITCDEWCDDWQQECAGGIHFFITREEAEAW